MALDVGAVRAAMKTTLDTALGTDTQIATAPDQVTPPSLLIGMPAVEYDKQFGRGSDVMRIPIHVILPRMHDQAAVDKADELISGTGGNSIITILYADRTLGGACSTLRVEDALPEFWPGAGGELPSYQLTVEVHG